MKTINPALLRHTHLQATQINAQPRLTNKYACLTARTIGKALAITAASIDDSRSITITTKINDENFNIDLNISTDK